MAQALWEGRDPCPPAAYPRRHLQMDALLLRALDTGALDGAAFLADLFARHPAERGAPLPGRAEHAPGGARRDGERTAGADGAHDAVALTPTLARTGGLRAGCWGGTPRAPVGWCSEGRRCAHARRRDAGRPGARTLAAAPLDGDVDEAAAAVVDGLVGADASPTFRDETVAMVAGLSSLVRRQAEQRVPSGELTYAAWMLMPAPYLLLPGPFSTVRTVGS